MKINRFAQPSIGQRHFEQMSNWRAKQREFADTAIANNQAITDAFLTINTNKVQGMAEISTRMAVSRIETQYQKRIAELQKLA
jgi:hypothetical protein